MYFVAQKNLRPVLYCDETRLRVLFQFFEKISLSQYQQQGYGHQFLLFDFQAMHLLLYALVSSWLPQPQRRLS